MSQQSTQRMSMPTRVSSVFTAFQRVVMCLLWTAKQRRISSRTVKL
jgi:hypothetical protein